jgi:hypothetical protein
MGQLPPRFVHESWPNIDMAAARNAYLAMRPFVLFMRGGATVVIARQFRTFMNAFGRMMSEIAEMNEERWARVDAEMREIAQPLELLPLPDGRPGRARFQAFAGQAHQLPVLRDLPNMPLPFRGQAQQLALEDAPQGAAAAAEVRQPVAGLNAAQPLPMPAEPKAKAKAKAVPRPGERPPPGEAKAKPKAKAVPPGPTRSSRAGVPPELQSQPQEPPPWAQRPGARPPRGGNKPMRKELIHVPQHVLQYFDVGNDPFYINNTIKARG